MNWLRRFMMGRYGVDQLTYGLIAVSILLSILARMTRLDLLSIAGFVLLAICYLRMLSRDINRRAVENQKFLQFWTPLRDRFKGLGGTVQDSRTHRHYKCPSCGQKIRVPRGRGKIRILCPSCQNEFIKKT